MIVRHLRKLSRSLKRYNDFFKAPVQILAEVRGLADLVLRQQTREFQAAQPNPLNRFGGKCFSQGDQDGITLEILRRIGALKGGTYAEFGVGNGTENNTLILAMLGWKGFWVGGEKLAFNYRPSPHFTFFKEWVTRENILDIANRGMSHLAASALDVVSIDMDGNDYYFAEALLNQRIRPKLFIVEYNAKFPPPIAFKIKYDPEHVWKGDDYMGASLESLAGLFRGFDYQLICCNSQTGTDAFFVNRDYANEFSDVPADTADIYVEPRYHAYRRYGHNVSAKLIEELLCA